jgi:hypothetical protein
VFGKYEHVFWEIESEKISSIFADIENIGEFFLSEFKKITIHQIF